MRSKTITFHATGMKPNTRVYAFFDDVDVNENCTAGIRRLFTQRAFIKD